MVPIELKSGPVYIDRAELIGSLEGLSAEFVILTMEGMDSEAVARELLASGADLVCSGRPFTEAVKAVGDVPVSVDRTCLSVPELPAAVRLEVLRQALESSSGAQFSPAEGVVEAGGAVLLLD